MEELVMLPQIRNLEVELPIDEMSEEFILSSPNNVLFKEKEAQARAIESFKRIRVMRQSKFESLKIGFNFRTRHTRFDFTVKPRFQYASQLGFSIEKAIIYTGPLSQKPLEVSSE
jgi:hypothetical protein